MDSWRTLGRVSLRVAACLIGLAGVSGACDRSPTGPSSAGAPAARTLRSLDIVGPTLVATGETVRYRASARYSTGPAEDVTSTAQWAPVPNPRTSIYFTGPGVAIAAQPGDSMVWATYGATVGSSIVLVLDPGTFKLAGIVTESGGAALSGGLHAAAVEVVSGTGHGQRATVDEKGHYALYGIVGTVRVQASASGFVPHMTEVAVTSHGAAHNFALSPIESTADVSGHWTMTVVPSASCRPGLPESARGRPYQIELVQQGTRTHVTFIGATVTAHNPLSHGGIVLGSRVQLHFPGDTGGLVGEFGEWSAPDIYDQLSPTERFGFDGVVNGTVTGSVIRATLNGDLVYDKTEPNRHEPVWYCRAQDHEVTLRR